MGRITLSPHMRLYAQMDELLKGLYTRSGDKEKREVLEKVIKDASMERGAWMNCDILDPLTFILLTALVYDIRDLLRLEKMTEELSQKLRRFEAHSQGN